MQASDVYQTLQQEDKTAKQAAMALAEFFTQEARPETDEERAEVETAFLGLLQYAQEASPPIPEAVFALTESYDERIIPVMCRIIKEGVRSRDETDVQRTFEALVGLRRMRNPPVATLQLAVQYGHAYVQSEARKILDDCSERYWQPQT